jgi:hypothetical protein
VLGGENLNGSRYRSFKNDGGIGHEDIYYYEDLTRLHIFSFMYFSFMQIGNQCTKVKGDDKP